MEKVPTEESNQYVLPAPKPRRRKLILMLLGAILLAAFLVPRIIKAVSDYYPEVIMKYRMPIIYVWLGGSLPLRYKKRLEWVTFPYKLVGEAQWEQLAGDFKNENLTTIERSDIMRLLYLQRHGGLYADFDMLLNYDCLMSTVAKFKGFVAYHSWVDANAIMFSDQEYNQDIRYALGQIKERLKTHPNHQKMLPDNITGPWIFWNNPRYQSSQDFRYCAYHQLENSWRIPLPS